VLGARGSDIVKRVDECVDGIVASGPRAIRLQKELITKWEKAKSRDEAVEHGVKQFRRAFETREPQEYMDLTFFKRKKGGESESKL